MRFGLHGEGAQFYEEQLAVTVVRCVASSVTHYRPASPSCRQPDMSTLGRRRYKELQELEESAAYLDLESARAHALIDDLTLMSELDWLARDVTGVGGLANDLEELHDRGMHFAVDYELNAVLSCALERARDLAKNVASGAATVDGDTVGVLSSEFATALEFVRNSAAWADNIRANNAARRAQIVGRRARRWPTRAVSPAGYLVTTAARLLPAAYQARYVEEYQSELWDLAKAGAGRIAQLRYALCQLCCSLPMGLTLRSPRRRGAAP